ncbi:MAG: flagella basal body P-ring formation protein FlgA, partial [Myxococcota bacterium]
MTALSRRRALLFCAAWPPLLTSPAFAMATVEVSHPTIRLSDLLGERGAGLEHIELGRTPPGGGSRVIRRKDIEAALTEAGVVGISRLPTAVRVVRKMDRLAADALNKLARDALKTAGLPKGAVRTRFRPPRSVRVPAGYDRVSISVPKPPRRDGRWNCTAMLSFHHGEEQLVRIAIPTELELSKAAAKPDIEKGDSLILIVRSGAVEVQVRGSAGANADVGDGLPIMLRPSGKVVLGRLVAPRR